MNCLPSAESQCKAETKLKNGVWCGSYSGARYCGGCVDAVFTVQDANATLEALRTQNRSNFDLGPTVFGMGYVPENIAYQKYKPL